MLARTSLIALTAVALGCGRDRKAPAEAPPAPPATCTRDVGQVQPVAGPARPDRARRPVHTFSIVARDAATGQLGVAVQSHWFAVGNGVVWAAPGVGAVATQSFAETGYGRKGLAAMAQGEAAPAVLARLVADDAAREVRQVGMVDVTGRVATHTGASCIAHAGHHQGDGYTVQANLMANDRVVPAMADAYETARGDLADRMMAALEAAQAAGGDIRGCQSAALRVVRGTASAEPSHDVVFDLRVDEAADPIGELRRLLARARVYDHMNAGDAALEHGDQAAARDHYRQAAAAAPDDPEVRYWQAVTMATSGDVEASLPLFRTVFAADRRFVEVTRRLQPAVIPATADGTELIDRIIATAP